MNIRSILSNECRYKTNIIWKDWVSIYLIRLYILFWVSVLCEESFTIFFTCCLGDIFKIAIILFWQVRQHEPLFSLYIYSLWIITPAEIIDTAGLLKRQTLRTKRRLIQISDSKKNYIPQISHNKIFVLGHCYCSWFL